MLANVNGAMNAVYLTGDAVGPILLYGQGAGMMPTASAVVSDLIDLARNLRRGVPGRVPALGWVSALDTRRLIKPINDLVTNYYLRFSALDRPGVLSQVSGILGKHNISIAAVIQKGREVAGTVPIVMITHEAREADARQAMTEIDQLPIVSPPTVFYRIEDPHLHAAQETSGHYPGRRAPGGGSGPSHPGSPDPHAGQRQRRHERGVPHRRRGGARPPVRPGRRDDAHRQRAVVSDLLEVARNLIQGAPWPRPRPGRPGIGPDHHAASSSPSTTW